MPELTLDVLEALRFAAIQHQYLRRGGYDRLPYINHLIKVTDHLLRIGEETDRDLLVAAALHDVVEDTAVTVEQLAEQFGKKVAATVEEVTDDMSLPEDERKTRQIKTASSLSAHARKIRIVDKASNLLDIFSYPVDWPKEKKQKYIADAQAIVNQIRGTSPKLEAFFDEAVAFAKQQLNDL